jgi:glutaredoxin
MNQTDHPNALLLVSSRCPHCHALETLLRERMATGLLGKLEVINIDQTPEVAQQYGVRSVPWLRLGSFVFDEALTPAELDRWIEQAKQAGGQSRYIAHLLGTGRLVKAIEWIEAGNARLMAIMPLLADPDEKINVRAGVGAILEHFEDTPAIRALVPDLIALLQDSNPMIRTDACHYLSLTHCRDAIDPLKQLLEDEEPQVREVAAESLEALMNPSHPAE